MDKEERRIEYLGLLFAAIVGIVTILAYFGISGNAIGSFVLSNIYHHDSNSTASTTSLDIVNSLSTNNSSEQNSSVTQSTLANMQTHVCYNPVNGTCYGDIVYSALDTNLTGNVSAEYDIVIYPGSMVTTDGYSMIAGDAFNNSGIIDTGNYTGQLTFVHSYAGSGGGSGRTGSASGCGIAGDCSCDWNTDGFDGEGTLVSGGSATTSGSTPPAPNLTSVAIKAWYTNNIKNYLSGGGGGGEGGGYSVYGIYIQAYKIIAGTIDAEGQDGISGNLGGGGSGGGVVLLAYGHGGVLNGNINITGGRGAGNSGSASCNPSGGSGGDGQILYYNYGSTPPVIPPTNTT